MFNLHHRLSITNIHKRKKLTTYNMTIIDGKKISNDIQDEIAIEVNSIKSKNERIPHLAAVLVGNDGASETYVAAKVKACERVGFKSTLVRMLATTSEDELLKKLEPLLVPHWRDFETNKAGVKIAISDYLFTKLPEPTYTQKDCETKGYEVYNFIYEVYPKGVLI